MPAPVTSQHVGSITLEPWMKPKLPRTPMPTPRGFGLAGVIVTAISVAGALGGDSFRDTQLAKMGYGYDPETGLAVKTPTPNTGYRSASPPFTGGQEAGVVYFVRVEIGRKMWDSGRGEFGAYHTFIRPQGWFFGPISSIRLGRSPIGATQEQVSLQIEHGVGSYEFPFQTTSTDKSVPWYYEFGVDLISIERADGGPDTSGEPASTSVGTPSGYTGNDGESNADKKGRSIAPPPPLGQNGGGGNSTAQGGGTGNSQKSVTSNQSQAASFAANGSTASNSVGASSSSGSNSSSSSSSSNSKNKVAPPPEFKPTPTPKPPAPAPTPKPKEREEEKKVAPPPPPPSNPDRTADILTAIGVVGLGISAIGSRVTNIEANTAPQAQVQNAKTGSCQSLNDPSCTDGLANKIKDPINQNIDATKAMSASILGNQATQNAAITGIATEQAVQKGVLASILSKVTDTFAKVGDVFNLVGKAFNNSVFDRAMQYITLITVIHNATMLTQSIGSTLGTSLDQGLQAFGLQARMEDKDGVVTGVNAVIGKSFENLIKAIIGQERYTQLDETWKKANRVYQASINLVSNVQSILDSTTAVAELSCNRVGILMNALRNSGMVREEAYGLQSQNVTKFNAFMNKLEALEQGTSNLAAITGNIVSVQQSVNELKSNRQELEDALKNKDKGNGAPENTPEKEALKEKREETLFTIQDFSIVRPPEQT